MYVGTPTQVRFTPGQTLVFPEEGDPCLNKRCKGKVKVYYPMDNSGYGCTCFQKAPCARCTSSGLRCDTCFEDQEVVFNRRISHIPFRWLSKRRRRKMIEKIKKSNSDVTA